MKQVKNAQLDSLWQAYKSENNQKARDKIILHYSPLVKYVASRLAANLPASIEVNDLVSYGLFGLIDAIEKFDPARQIKFETYAIPRIRGAIIDELRSLDWVPRSVRAKSKELEKVYIELENKLKRVPTDEEVAETMGLSIKELHQLYQQLSYTSIVALDELWTGGTDKEETLTLIDTVEDASSADPSQVFEQEEVKEVLAQAIDNLPEREKIVVALYYYEGLTLKEIGEVLNVTESRVSQLHTKAIFRLRAKLNQARVK